MAHPWLEMAEMVLPYQGSLETPLLLDHFLTEETGQEQRR